MTFPKTFTTNSFIEQSAQTLSLQVMKRLPVM